MEKAEFLSNLEDLIEAEPGSLSAASVLAETPGWDSMAIMGFIAFADESLGSAPAPKAIKACQTVADLMALVGI
jgi:acyl carrier protein